MNPYAWKSTIYRGPAGVEGCRSLVSHGRTQLACSETLRSRAVRLLRGALVIGLLLATTTGVAASAPESTTPESAPTAAGRAADGPLLFDTNLGLIERTTMQAVQEALEGLRLDPGSDILLFPMTTHSDRWFIEDCMARVLSEKGYRVHLESAANAARAAAAPGPASVPRGPGSLADAMNRTNNQAAGNKGNNLPANGVAPGDTLPAPNTIPAPDRTGADDAEGATTVSDPTRFGRNHEEMLAQANAAAQRAANAPAANQGADIPLPEGEGLVLSYRIIEFGVTYHDSWRQGFMGPRMVERLASVNIYTRLVNGSAQDVLWVGRGRAERLDVVPKGKLDLLEGRNYPFQKPELRTRPLSRLAEPVLVSGIIAGLVFLFYSSQN